MKFVSHTTHCARQLAARLALSATLIAAAPMPILAANETKKDEKGFAEKVERWEERMTDKFRETWHKLWGEKKGGSMSENSIATASVDLREQKDSYTVRLNLPKRDLEK